MKKNIYSGKFIVFEGLDGSGQSTQAKILEDFLTAQGYQVLLTKEPTSVSLAGQKIRRALDKKEKISPRELQALFVEDRRTHLEEEIVPALKAGRWVISDRYAFSTFAFGAADGLDLEELKRMNADFLLPDITFLLKVSPSVCMRRIQKRGQPTTLFEKEKKLEQVWENYRLLPEQFENIYVIDGEASIAKVAEAIQKIIKEKLL